MENLSRLNKNKVTIKKALLGEVLAVHKKIPEFVPNPPFKLVDFKSEIEGKKSFILIATVDKEPAGYSIGYDKFKDGSFYHWLAGVIPKYRDKGVYIALQTYLENWAKKNGYKSLKVKTWNRRIAMRIILAKTGYNVIGFEDKPDVLDARLMHEKLL